MKSGLPSLLTVPTPPVATLQRRAIDQLAGQVPPQVAQVASQLARGRLDQASQQHDSRRLIDRLDSSSGRIGISAGTSAGTSAASASEDRSGA
jgi:hypothetical protein